jgi:hypothetical protein
MYKKRIQAGNKAYYVNLQMFQSKIISRRSKLQIYKKLLRPVVTYGAETWTINIHRRECFEEVRKKGTEEDIRTSDR